ARSRRWSWASCRRRRRMRDGSPRRAGRGPRRGRQRQRRRGTWGCGLLVRPAVGNGACARGAAGPQETGEPAVRPRQGVSGAGGEIGRKALCRGISGNVKIASPRAPDSYPLRHTKGLAVATEDVVKPETGTAAAAGHPIGFWFFFWGEFAERSSYYGMRAIL